MSENEIKEENTNPNTKKLKVSFHWFFNSLKSLLIDTLNIRQDADIPGTIESVNRDVVFKGHNIWILILSILIASIGLNTNSGAVIIGAMLISPLMGPIMGIGLAIGTNDLNLLASAVRNLIIMVVVAVGTSYLYFHFTPFTEAQSEILARTRPHLLDAFIAIFGGLAGIIGNSRKERSNIVPGVAIATALMPPLCTVGYGLAVGNYEYTAGAMYLFTLNSSFICIATIVLVRVMRFPIVHFVNPKNEKKVKVAIFIFAVLILIPSFYLFRGVMKEADFKRQAKIFLQNEFTFNDSYILQHHAQITSDSSSIIEVYVLGEPLDSIQEIHLENQMINYRLSNTELVIRQSKDKDDIFKRELQEVNNTSETYKERLEKANNTITFQEAQIRELYQEIDNIKSDTLPMFTIQRELQTIFPEVKSIAIGAMRYSSDSIVADKPTFMIEWDNSKYRRKIPSRKDELEKMSNWLKVRLKLKDITIY